MRVSGTAIADDIYHELEKRVGVLKKKNVIPQLAVLMVGQNPASVAYVNLKKRKGEHIGAIVTIHEFEEHITTEDLLAEIKRLNDDPTVHAILIQRPLPGHIDVTKLEQATDPRKDVDGFHPDSAFTLPLPLAINKILEKIYYRKINQDAATMAGNHDSNEFIAWLAKKNIVIMGKGQTGGGPIAAYLKKLHLTPHIVDSKTQNAQELMKEADIIIGATGKHLITPESIKKGVILLGVGISKGLDDKLHGDYESDEIANIAAFYTPTPGGVGPVNVAKLMENVITAAEEQTK